MSQTFSYIEDSNLTDNCVNPTTDVWLDKIEPLQSVLFEPWYANRLSQLPVRQMESRAAFEDDELLEQTVPEEIRIGERVNNLIASMSEEPARLYYFFYASVYLPTEKLRGLSLYQNEFSPDFFAIKRYIQDIMKSSPVSQIEKEQISKEQNISVFIHPEVVKETEEKCLAGELDICIKLVQDIYSSLKRINVSVEYDPEILERKTICLALTVSGEPETILQDETLFKQRLRSCIHASFRQLITVTYEWEE